MPILTKNQTPVKNQKAEFQLDKVALAAIISDTYFQNSDNWKSVDMIFRSSPGNQRKVIKFDASNTAETTALASFFASAKARDIFEIEKIVINDFDGGKFIVDRAELTVAEFDIDMTPTTLLTYEINPVTFATAFIANPANTQLVHPSFAAQCSAQDSSSLGTVVSGAATYDITFELDQFDVNGFTPSPIKIGWNQYLNNIQSSTGTWVVIMPNQLQLISYGSELMQSGSLGVPANFSGVRKIRMVQEGTGEIKVYSDDVLVFTSTITQSFDAIFPFIESYRSVRLIQSYKL